MPRKTDLSALVGQLLIFGFDGTTVSAKLRSTLATMQPGGIVLFARNIEEPRQTHALLRDAQRTVNRPMFLCVDMEGGTVDRLKNIIAPAMPAHEVYRSKNRRLFREHGHVIGEEVAALGFNTDFAPVLDLRFEASLPVMTSRTISPDPKQTVAYAREFLRGLKSAHVLGCGKHFPGLGEGSLDSHKDLPTISKPWKRLWEEDLAPYRTLRSSLPLVMVAHAAYPDVTKDTTPASISKKWITDVLRKKIGYKGLVISDDLEMGGVLNSTPIEQAAVETIRAGADIFLVCHNEEFVYRSYLAVLNEAEKNANFRRQVETAARRIMAFKKRSRELNGRAVPPPTDKTVDKLRRKLWLFDEEVRLAINVEAAATL